MYNPYGIMNNTPINPLNNGINWVQGENGARAWLMTSANSNVILMDAETSRFYIKSTDSMGIPSLRTFEYTEVINNHQISASNNEPQQVITREEWDALKGKIEALEKKLSRRKDNEPTISANE